MTESDNHQDFIVLLNASHRRLLAFLVSVLGNRHDAQDALQKASVTLWRRFADFEQRTDFFAWASTVAFYEAKNFQRMAARSRLRFGDELLELIAAERVVDSARTQARVEALDHCMEQLDAPSVALVEAAYFEEGSVARLAEQLGRVPQTLYNKLNILRRRLAECVSQRLAADGGAA